MKLLLTSFLCMFFLFAKADPQTFTGKLKVKPGDTENYTISWNNPIALHGYNLVSWTVSNGTIISSSKTDITIEWDFIPSWMNANGVITASEEFGGQEGTCYVSIENFEEGIVETCGGTLGPAAIYQNFGAGLNPGPALGSGSITYQFETDCFDVRAGKYTVLNSSAFCNSNWLVIPQDHTPNDVNGYMLLVDGDDNSGEVYRTTASNLTQSFSYEFSVYLANLSNPDNGYQVPRVQFEIYDLNGTPLGSSGSYPIGYDPSNPWQKLSFVFDIPQGLTSVQIVLRSQNNQKDGNDFLVDDLSFAPCYPPILASFSNSTIIDKSYTCNNGTVNLFSRWPTPTLPFANPRYKWQRNINSSSVWLDIQGATNQNFTINEPIAGVYTYRMIAYNFLNPQEFVTSNNITFFVQKMVVDAKTYNLFGCNSGILQLTPSYRLQFSDPGAPVNLTYTWSPGTYLNSTNIEKPTISLPPLPPPPAINSPNSAAPIIRNYNLTVRNTNFVGCVATNVQTIAHYNPRKVAIGNAFTPNGDGNNDLFRPVNLQDYPGAKFRIWNRWGNQVFYSEGPTLLNYSWNGFYGLQRAEEAVYTWSVDIPGCPNNILNGAGTNNVTNNPFGNVTLIR
jgi:gliding motility-associated-like protein